MRDQPLNSGQQIPGRRTTGAAAAAMPCTAPQCHVEERVRAGGPLVVGEASARQFRLRSVIRRRSAGPRGPGCRDTRPANVDMGGRLPVEEEVSSQPHRPGSLLMPFCPVVPPDVTSDRGNAAAELLGRAGMVAVRVADLASPARRGLGKDGRSALVAAGAGKIANGDPVVFCKPVAVAAAVGRRDGRVQAAGHPADHARLGVAEDPCTHRNRKKT